MTGYALFRGDTLVAHKFVGADSTDKLHDIGQQGDILVYLGINHIGTYLWNAVENDEGESWIPFSDLDSKKYRILALIQS